MSEAWAGRVPASRVGIGATVAVGAIGVTVGVLALLLSDLSAAWFAYVMAAVVLGTLVVSASHPRRLMLGLTVLSFQVNAKMYFLYQGGSGFVGDSGPVGLEFPLCSLPAIALLVMEVLGIDADGRRIMLPRRLLRPALYYLVAVGLTVFATPERFLWLCYMNQQVLLLVIFLAVANAIHDEHDVDLVVNLLVLSVLLQAVAYFTEAATGIKFNFEGNSGALEGGVKGHGGTVHTRSNGLAGFLLPLLILAVTRFLGRSGPGSKRLAMIAAASGAAALLASEARAAWIGCVAGVLVVLWLGVRHKLIGIGRVLLLGVGGLAIAAMFAHELVDRFSSDHARDYEERAALMRMAWNVFTSHPLIGCGAGAYGKVFRAYLSDDLRGRWLFIVHNRFLLVAAETGIVGILAFLAMFRAWLRESYALLGASSMQMRLLGIALCGGIVGILWHQYWDTLMGFPMDGLIFGLMGFTAALSEIARGTAAGGGAEP